MSSPLLETHVRFAHPRVLNNKGQAGRGKV